MAKVPDSSRTKIGKRERTAEGTARSQKQKRSTGNAGVGSARALRTRSGSASGSEVSSTATPVLIRAHTVDAAVSLPDDPGAAKVRTKKSAPARRRPRQTFLVAATLSDAAGAVSLGVYAVVTRSPAEALAAVRDLLGPDVPIGLTGKLSGRMAKALELRPGEARRI